LKGNIEHKEIVTLTKLPSGEWRVSGLREDTRSD
jgi:hypothetical protein